MSTNALFNNAELALAAYATLNTSDLATQKPALLNAGLSGPQTDVFSSHYQVVSQFNDTTTSFSATVFKDTSDNLTLAIRGTLEAGDFIPTDIKELKVKRGQARINSSTAVECGAF
jgi:hypothetical protein